MQDITFLCLFVFFFLTFRQRGQIAELKFREPTSVIFVRKKSWLGGVVVGSYQLIFSPQEHSIVYSMSSQMNTIMSHDQFESIKLC